MGRTMQYITQGVLAHGKEKPLPRTRPNTPPSTSRIFKEPICHSLAGRGLSPTSEEARREPGAAGLSFAFFCIRPPPSRDAGGADRDRTGDPLLAKQVLSQLSYSPDPFGACRRLAVSVVGLDGFEPSTPALSRRCSNQLSYRPGRGDFEEQPIDGEYCERRFSRKEVIQPHLPIRLPCYDFTPVTNLTVVGAPLAVRLPASGETRSHGVTGGVYKTRERIHRDMLIRDY